MFQLRRILLSGLVALLMVGMVTAGDVVGDAENSPGSIDGGVGFYTGTWNTAHTICTQTSATECFRLWIDWDLTWIKNLFN